MARRVFYSFHYKPDSWRAAQVRNIRAIEGNKPALDNDWEEVVGGGDKAIKRWIAEQMCERSCTVVLVGTKTADRKWINHEIVESWKQGMGVVGIHINGLEDRDGRTSSKGRNPFEYFTIKKHTSVIKYRPLEERMYPFDENRTPLSAIVKCYSPEGQSSNEQYAWIAKCLEGFVRKAIDVRKQFRDI